MAVELTTFYQTETRLMSSKTKAVQITSCQQVASADYSPIY